MEGGRGRLGTLRAAARCWGEIGNQVPLFAAPAVFQCGWTHVRPITLGNHGPKMNSMGVVDPIQPCHVNDRFLFQSPHVIRNQSKCFSLLRHSLEAWNGFGKDGHMIRRGRWLFWRSIIKIRAVVKVEWRKLALLMSLITQIPGRGYGRTLRRRYRR